MLKPLQQFVTSLKLDVIHKLGISPCIPKKAPYLMIAFLAGANVVLMKQ